MVPIEQSTPSDCVGLAASSKEEAFENGRTWMLLLLLGLAISFAAFCDWALAGLLPLSLYLAYIAAWTLVLLPLAGWRPSRRNGLILISFAAIVLVLYLVPSKRERFLHDLHRVSPGMARTEAEAIMSKYSRLEDQPDSEVSVFRHTVTGSRAADFGVVAYENGRVVSVEFQPD